MPEATGFAERRFFSEGKWPASGKFGGCQHNLGENVLGARGTFDGSSVVHATGNNTDDLGVDLPLEKFVAMSSVSVAAFLYW